MILFILYFHIISSFAQPLSLDLQTEDGAWITAYRYENTGPVVLLAQGITSNYRVWDLTSDISLSQYLHKQGFDVWMMDFRGDSSANKKRKQSKKLRQGYPFVFGVFDLKRMIEYIKTQRPNQQVNLISYSFSGLSFLHYVHHHSSDDLGKLVFLATPGYFKYPEPLWLVMSKTLRFLPFSIKTNRLAPIVSKISRLPLHMEQIIWNEENMDAKTRYFLLNYIFRPISRKEMKELIYIIDEENYPQAKKYDYTLQSVLEKVNNPSLVISGRLDQIASVDRVQMYYDYLGTSEKEFVIAGKMYGYKADYGHACLVMSPVATQEIYPQIRDFIYGK